MCARNPVRNPVKDLRGGAGPLAAWARTRRTHATHPHTPPLWQALVFVYQFGACVGYLLVIQEQALPLFLEWTPNSFLATEGGLFLTTMVVVTPLCMLRTLNALQYTSFIGVAARAAARALRWLRWHHATPQHGGMALC